MVRTARTAAMVATLLLLLILLMFSAFFSGAELAIFSLGMPRVRTLVQEGRPGAATLERLKKTPERLLITILIGNNVANIGAASVATYAATEAFGSSGVGLATGIMTLLVLFFGEVTPKSLATRHAAGFALVAAPTIAVLNKILFVLVRPLEWLVSRLLPPSTGVTNVSEAEIRAMARLGQQAGDIESHERRLIDRVFTLDELRAREIMTPRVDIVALEDKRVLSDVVEELRGLKHSRIPVYGESLDDVTGVLYSREVHEALLADEGDKTLSEVAREPFFVPDIISLIELLRQFQARRVHMALVVDEHGGLDGLVTLEDILEELVGEIEDETDEPEEPLQLLREDLLVADGGADLRAINERFDTKFPESEPRSLNGLLLAQLGRVPEVGEVHIYDDVRIRITRATDTQVIRARLKRITPPLSGSASDTS